MPQAPQNDSSFPPYGYAFAGCGYIADLACAIRAGRPPRASGELAAHIVEIFCGAEESMHAHRPVELSSDFPTPAPLEWSL